MIKVSHDLLSHRSAWRGAIVDSIHNSPPPSVDQDDFSFWKHELEVFDRVFDQLEELHTEGKILLD